MTLLQMSFSGALMILIIASLRFLLQRKVHRNVWIFLWLTVVLRLLIPFSLPASTSFYNLPVFRAAQAAPQAAAPAESLSAAASTLPSAPSINPLTVIWLIGAAVILLVVVSNHLYHLRRYRFSLPCTASLPPMPKGVQVRTLENLDAPLTYGIAKPTILLPSRFPIEDTKRLNHVLQHELSHIRNRDILTKLVLIIAAAIHWFNPLVWLMVLLASQDMEMRCDAQAVSMLDNERIAYARSLVAAEEDRICGYLQAGFSHSATERRILALTKDRAIPVVSVVVCTAMLLLLSAVFMTGQANASPSEVPIEPTTDIMEEPQETVVHEEPPAAEEPPEPPEETITIPVTEEIPSPEPDPLEPENAAPETGDPETSEIQEPEIDELEAAKPEAPVDTEPAPDAESVQSSYAPKPAQDTLSPQEIILEPPEIPEITYSPSSSPNTSLSNIPEPTVYVIEIFGENPGVTAYSASDPYLETIGPQRCIP